MNLSIFVLLITWYLAVVYHQSLYVIFPMLGLIYFFYSDFTLSLNQVTKPFLLLFLSVAFIFIVQTFYLCAIWQYHFEGLGRYSGYLMAALFVSAFNRRTLNLTLLAILIVIYIQFPFEIVSMIKGIRFRGIFHHPNHYAYVLNVMLFYLLFGYSKVRFYKTSVIIVLLSILGTLSSGGLLTATAIIFGKFIHRKRLWVVYLFFGIIVVSLLSISFYFISDRFQEQVSGIINFDFQYIIDRANIKNAGGNPSLIWRLIYWLSILFEFSSEKMIVRLFGTGLDSMTIGNYIYDFMFTDPHNDYLKVLIELGLIGFILFLIFQKMLYSANHKSMAFLFLITIPFFFGNVLVNFPFIFTLILVLSEFAKSENHIQTSEIKGNDV